MNLFTGAIARRIGIREGCLALVLLAGLPLAQAFELSKIRWWEMQSDILLDDPETATLQLEPFPLPGLAQPPARVILSQYHGLFYLNGYADGQYRQRVYKSPPLPLFDAQALQACVPEQRPVEATDNWPSSKQLEAALSLTKLSFDCQSPGWQLSNRYLLVDSRDPQRPLLAIGQRQGEARIDFTPQQPISPELQQQWQQALHKYPKLLEPFDASSGQLTVQPYVPAPSPEQVWTEFRQLHAQLRDAKDKAPGIARAEAFFTRHDFRAIAPERSAYPGLLNDIAYWATEAGHLQSARPWLAYVLRRDPGRVPTYLNLADLDWRLYQQQPTDSRHLGRAKENYRLYCGLRLQRQLGIPARVTQRLDLAAASEQTCQGSWPLVTAVDQGDEAEVRRLLQNGLRGDVIADDGRPALLHALDKPNFYIARLLLTYRARPQGQYNGRTQVFLAMRRDLKDNPDLSQAKRLNFLLQAGAAIDEQDAQGGTVLQAMAKERDDIERFNWLLQHPQDLDKRSGPDGETALFLALKSGNYAAARPLIEAGANLNLSYGRNVCAGQPIRESLLMIVAEQGSPEVINPWVSQQESLDMFTLLLQRGADPNVGRYCANNGYTWLLEIMARRKRDDMLKVLQGFAPPPPATAFRL
ncbi:ankyrin repeat domain-containing protein [Pseudomonas sp. Au-Pse12]|uniref:ankyrin repeat domain-containing protein n=1 Tax=Pseudomonas sp. Au-Pse12 TaxID=2906459 RepID=UPI001E49580D|nr:ankyrin repeat domain-containing protein [Pseudomonas sp. Au-Pse12]MCE4054793.1 ankyrin repeat domain-containing protein [Pseudomonas sp. Au-Pse12]